MSETLENLLILVRDLATEHLPRRYKTLDEAVNELKELTRNVWTPEHKDLILRLDELNRILHKDYQLFWFECLKFPYSWPVMSDLQGIPVNMRYEHLPSDFNDVYFHDSIINTIVFDKNLMFDIDIIEMWEEDGYGWRQKGCKAKLSFNNVVVVCKKVWLDDEKLYKSEEFKSDELLGQIILYFMEVPAINYAFKELGLEEELCLSDKRIFLLEGLFGLWTRIIIVCDDWRIGKYGDYHDIGYAFMAKG